MEKRLHKLLDEEAVAATNLTEMMYLKRQQLGQSSQSQGPDSSMRRLCLGRQLLLPSSSPGSVLGADATAHIRIGSYYEIDHTKLPTKSPDQLKSVRVIMVSKKCRSSVSLRYPSEYSLRAHLRERNRIRKMEQKMLPSLDELYAMGSDLAGDVLYRRIPPHEIALRRNEWDFWVRNSPNPNPNPNPAIYVNMLSKKGFCWYEMKSKGLVQWGRRRQVRFFTPHVQAIEQRRERSLSRTVEEEGEDNIEEEDDDEGEEKEILMVTDHEENKQESDKKICKRKLLQGATYKTQMQKKLKKNQQISLYKPKKEAKNCIDRWSCKRYNLAAENMLKIMKETGAVFGNPIVRPALRAEARRLIGDTGLLDHLLKHMAGKVAPGGEERFMRRHNADGAMEYWLESADLMEIRKEAGVKDPYWTPPPGWKLGDNPTQDPVCARELRALREEIAKLKHHACMDLNVPVFTTTPNNNKLHHTTTLLLPLKEKYANLMNMKAKVEGQLAEIAQSICGLEEEMGKLKSIVEDPVLIMGSTTPPLDTERETKEMEKSNKTAPVIFDIEEDKDTTIAQGKNQAVAITEDKVAKIERLKSGFRVCKPQGSFLWPNMTSSSSTDEVNDHLFAIPTPPSVSSFTTTTTAPRLVPKPTSTVKPLAKKRSSTVAVMSKHPHPLEATTAQYATTSSSINLNLNEVPDNPGLDHGRQIHSSPCSLTYQRRNFPRMMPGKKEDNRQQHPRGSSHRQAQAVGAGTWLALSTPTSSMDNNNPRRV